MGVICSLADRHCAPHVSSCATDGVTVSPTYTSGTLVHPIGTRSVCLGEELDDVFDKLCTIERNQCFQRRDAQYVVELDA